MKQETDFFISKDGDRIFHYYFSPESGDIKGVVQIVHGIGEHAGRYRALAKELTDRGFYVCANDHRGYGRSAKEGLKGHIGNHDGYELLINDMYELMGRTKRLYPNVPYIMFGHSMGSFLTRSFIIRYGSFLNGVILSGTKGSAQAMENLALPFAKFQRLIFGKKAKGNLINKLSTGGYSKKYFPSDNSSVAWLSSDKDEQNKFLSDEYCLIGPSSIETYVQIFTGIEEVLDESKLIKIPKNLPILLISGDKDPLGDFGKGVSKLCETYKRAGFENVSIKIYKNARHEVLNEVNKNEVIHDIVKWIKRLLKSDEQGQVKKDFKEVIKKSSKKIKKPKEEKNMAVTKKAAPKKAVKKAAPKKAVKKAAPKKAVKKAVKKAAPKKAVKKATPKKAVKKTAPRK